MEIVPRETIPFLLRVAPWGLLLVFMAKVGTFENARHLSPYYIFLFPLFLVRPGHAKVVRQRQWQHLGLVVMGFTLVMVFASGDRPLFPARTIFEPLNAKFSGCELINEEYRCYVISNYQVTRARRDYLEKALPADGSPVGYYAVMYDVDELGIWLPYGRRGVECISPDDSPERLRSLGIHYVVVNCLGVNQTYRNIGKWMDKYDASLVDTFTFIKQSRQTPDLPDLYLVRLN
jgi:hypothetical protein